MVTFATIRSAMALTNFDGEDAQMSMVPPERRLLMPDPAHPPRQSAVLVLIYPKADSSLHLILTKRTDKLRGHSGQVSFPGGSRDPEDPSYEATALRETCEELGFCDPVEIIGQLARLWIPPSNFEVTPIVAITHQEPILSPNPDEVESVLHLPILHLLSPEIKRKTAMNFRGKMTDVPYFDVDGHVVWGATAAMLGELELRLRRVLGD